ncbi:MAG: hypothetical protein V4550_01585 [Gemmatimonadota bacterium]
MTLASRIESLSAHRGTLINVAWAFGGNLIYAGCQWGMLIVLAKAGDPSFVGTYALALAIAAPVFNLSNLQLRGLQAADARGLYRFNEYLRLRILTNAGALIVLALTGAVNPEYRTVYLVLMLVTAAKLIESVSDVIFGLLQRNRNIRRIAISQAIKGTASVVSLGIGMKLAHSLELGVLLVALSWLAVLLFFDIPSKRLVIPGGLLDNMRVGADRKLRREWSLAVFAFPIAMVLAINSVAVNVPRYYLADSVGVMETGYYSSIAYIAVAIGVLTTAICTSILPSLADAFLTDKKLFLRYVSYALLVVFAVTLVSGVVSYEYGGLILTLLYKPDYARYADVLVVTAISAGIANMGAILGTAVTAANSYWPQVATSLVFLGCAYAGCIILIPKYGVLGASLAYGAALVVQLLAVAANLAWLFVHPTRNSQALHAEGAEHR